MDEKIIIGTRGSKLAVRQTQIVIDKLQKFYPAINFMIQKITTKGDKISNTSSSFKRGEGIFVKEIQHALLKGEIDLAVHSLKDLPIEIPKGITLAAVLKRDDPRDVLIGKGKLMELPTGATIGTSSQRRKIQLLALRGDLQIVDCRGNLDTRIRKLENLSGIIVAACGLVRLNKTDLITEYLAWQKFLPAVGQGVIAIEARSDDKKIADLIAPLNDHSTELEIRAEREFLARLGGGCELPIAAYAHLENGNLILEGMLAKDGQILKDKYIGKKEDPEFIGKELAKRIMNKF